MEGVEARKKGTTLKELKQGRKVKDRRTMKEGRKGKKKR
jgi:hypothetical protein